MTELEAKQKKKDAAQEELQNVKSAIHKAEGEFKQVDWEWEVAEQQIK